MSAPGAELARCTVEGDVALGSRTVHRRLPVERFMGWARLVGSALALLQFGAFTHYPTGVRPTGLVLALVFTAFGAWTLRWTSGDRDPGTLERVMARTLALDAVLLVAINLLLAYERDSTTRGLLFLVVLEGAMKFGSRGAYAVAGTILAMELARMALRTLVHELPSDLAETTFFMGLSFLVAAFAGQMSKLAGDALSEADRHGARSELARSDLQSLHRVLLSGIDAITSLDGMESMLTEAAATIGFGSCALARVDDERGVELVYSSRHGFTRTGLAARHPVHRALAEPGMGPIRQTYLDHLVLAIAVPGREGPLGVLMFCDPLNDRRAGDEMLRSLASQVGMVLRVADAFEYEHALGERLQQLDLIKNDFITVASHELRTPLAAISGAAETLVHRREVVNDSEAKQLDRIILRQAGRLTALVDDLTTVLDIDNGRLRVLPEQTRLLPVVLSAVERSDVAVELLGVEGREVVADPARLEQVLVQLLSNAAEHAEGTALSLDAREERSQVVISVRDGGPGIDPVDAPHIFDRFFQSVDALAHQRGTGLGLPIARELARAMGGDVVYVPMATGACFEVRVPVVEPDLTVGHGRAQQVG